MGYPFDPWNQILVCIAKCVIHTFSRKFMSTMGSLNFFFILHTPFFKKIYSLSNERMDLVKYHSKIYTENQFIAASNA